ncbi:uncharacterized protein ANIA_11261 [Aspergillus nidulans FGSC A4]|uniref:Uncharacterized protein n=1 Tax=Emericella nidulans (strain FGSC A4 / ATCC 38163 / CBS 112.46 / NRRL 194 / M139) TaxID=227321 RepID=C8VQ42_EMENI|nr:hypothetical protein [Aspergillus nidulans FGSC A4]CBF90054.1 TPA: hypothetical protein ANIA_11261 [Aspergillus nidulans FGSC A4]
MKLSALCACPYIQTREVDHANKLHPWEKYTSHRALSSNPPAQYRRGALQPPPLPGHLQAHIHFGEMENPFVSYE